MRPRALAVEASFGFLAKTNELGPFMPLTDEYWMGLALELAKQGQGLVEPNPMVGCVVVHDNQLIASGYHQRFGGPHAEVEALRQCDPAKLPNSTVYVTLEPCSHFGKTPPCVNLFLQNKPQRIVVAMQDPFPEVSARGIAKLRENQIQVDVGTLQSQAATLNSPYLKRIQTGRPWVIAKWAMTLDGAIATRDGDSKWISSEISRGIVHELRSRLDAIIIGSGTAIADDPLLTTRLKSNQAPKRVASRVVLDRQLRISTESKLVRSCDQGAVIIATSELADPSKIDALCNLGCEVLRIPEHQLGSALRYVLGELGKRNMTNVLIEGGQSLLGNAFDEGLVDEVHCFIAPKIVGGVNALRPVGGAGCGWMRQAQLISNPSIVQSGADVYLHGVLDRQD